MADERDEHVKMLSNRLVDAIHKNDIEQVRICINQGVDLTLENVFHSAKHAADYYACPLAHACCKGHEEIMEALLKAGADPNKLFGCESSGHVINMAAYEHNITLSMIQTLISYGADVNLRDGDGETILHYLARNEVYNTGMTCENLLSAVKFLLDNGASCYARDEDDITPLRHACRKGNIELVKLFIHEGLDANCDNGDRISEDMLEAAALSCKIDVFDLLLNAGAKKHLTPHALTQPCYLNDHAMIVRILETCDMDMNMATDETTGITILHLACYDRDITIGTVKLLLDHGADVRAICSDGDTALHYAVNKGDLSKICLLLAYNPPLNIKNNDNQTPLVKLMRARALSCRRAGRPRARVLAFKMLVAAGANVTADFERELNQLRIKHPQTQVSDYEISSTKSLQEICRLVIRGAIHVPVDASLGKLPIPELLQEYLNFPEFGPLNEEYLNLMQL